MSNFPIFSIVTPSYNQGSYIGETVESVISQSGDFYIDYIIMDGGSSDSTMKIIQEAEKKLQKDSRTETVNGLDFHSGNETVKCRGVSFRYFSEKDRGQSHALNKGYKIIIGSYFSWLNSDDKLLPGTLEKVKAVFSDPSKKLVYGGAEAYDSEGKLLWKHNPAEVTVYNMLYREEGVPQPSIFWRREITDDRETLVREELRYTMDTDLWFYFFRKRIKWNRIDDELSIQIYHPDSKSCEGDSMFEKFMPENTMIKTKFKEDLGFGHRYFTLLRSAEKKSKLLFKVLKVFYYF